MRHDVSNRIMKNRRVGSQKKFGDRIMKAVTYVEFEKRGEEPEASKSKIVRSSKSSRDRAARLCLCIKSVLPKKNSQESFGPPILVGIENFESWALSKPRRSETARRNSHLQVRPVVEIGTLSRWMGRPKEHLF